MFETLMLAIAIVIAVAFAYWVISIRKRTNKDLDAIFKAHPQLLPFKQEISDNYRTMNPTQRMVYWEHLATLSRSGAIAFADNLDDQVVGESLDRIAKDLRVGLTEGEKAEVWDKFLSEDQEELFPDERPH